MTAVIALGPSGLETARKIAAAVPGARVHGLAPDGVDEVFEDTASHLKSLFENGVPIIGVCAAGILIRALAPAIADKTTEPPVLAVAVDGSAVVPLLGGHHGANALARRLAETLDCPAAITTAGDLRFGVALDEPPAGFVLANPGGMKAFSARLLAGEKIRLEGKAQWLGDSALPFDAHGTLVVKITDDAAGAEEGTLVYHPRRLAIGVGCERGCDPAELTDLICRVLDGAGLAVSAVGAVVSLDLKSNEPAVHAAARMLGLEARFFDAAALEAEAPRLENPSDVVFAEVGCHGVAEGAALAAVGADGDLIIPKQKSKRATCALARAPGPIEGDRIGKAQGRLAVIGTGPGAPQWLTPEAAALVDQATDLVGYGLYLDLLGGRTKGKTCHARQLGEEEERVRLALDLAADGKRVVLVSSGDPGIYAMATLVYELLERAENPEWERLAVSVAPGISALQAASARIGAPLGHDFCTVSLSDLLTPWDVIENRVRAAAAGDFVIAFYNPVSKRRTTQLARARDILAEHRPGNTPVVLARNLGREGETVRVITLGELDPAEVDMLTLVLVGSKETRTIARGDGTTKVYTPRGYAGKKETPA